MKKTYKIVMLPTDRSYLGINKENKIKESRLKFTSGGMIIPQHLYILSDEEIVEDDKVYVEIPLNPTDSGIKTIAEITTSKVFHKEGGFDISSNLGETLPKVIASTDSSLGLPGIPQSYIEYYIEEYNRGNVIEKIELELTYDPTDFPAKIIYILKLHCFEVVPTYSIEIVFGDEEIVFKEDADYTPESTNKAIECLLESREKNTVA